MDLQLKDDAQAQQYSVVLKDKAGNVAAATGELTVSVSDSTVVTATLSADGSTVAIAPGKIGSAVVTVSDAADELSASINVTVTAGTPASIELDPVAADTSTASSTDASTTAASTSTDATSTASTADTASSTDATTAPAAGTDSSADATDASSADASTATDASTDSAASTSDATTDAAAAADETAADATAQ
ncbi:hypothetical protein [Pararobbsia silviterrae]|uniref:Uncharacterized protein n=1 Tax=Pararobbsia silviterrae TaxID=1792498 RepID=A0A494X1V9_9BURK|nr:hypothetical protein [Pararobbsia silviterrae]RKP44718.1 hypothetical protein D7S86_27205 [Pararobbsia silviterrae]